MRWLRWWRQQRCAHILYKWVPFLERRFGEGPSVSVNGVQVAGQMRCMDCGRRTYVDRRRAE